MPSSYVCLTQLRQNTKIRQFVQRDLYIIDAKYQIGGTMHE